MKALPVNAPADGRAATAPPDLRGRAIEAAQRRLQRAVRFLELSAGRALFERAMRLDGGRRVKVGLYLPGPVLVQFDPDTGEVLTRSLPGQLDQLDAGFLDE